MRGTIRGIDTMSLDMERARTKPNSDSRQYDPRYIHRGYDESKPGDPNEAIIAQLKIMERYGGKSVQVGEIALTSTVELVPAAD